jgi:hypothetical protein
MATRTQKAAARKRSEAEKAKRANDKARKDKALEREADKFEKAIDAQERKEAKAAKAKAKKGRKPALEFQEVQSQEPAKPGFFERLRVRREERTHQREAQKAQEQLERIAAEERRQAEAGAAREAAEREAVERAKQEAAEARKAAAQARRDEAKAARDEEKRTAAEAEAEKERRSEEAKERRRQEREAKRLAMEEAERHAAEQAEEADRSREAAKAARKAKRAEVEPDLEFEEASEPVADENALVPAEAAKAGDEGKPGKAGPAGDEAGDDAAARMAAELARRRSKPVVVIEEDAPMPRIPKAAPAAPPQDLDLSEPEVRQEFQTAPPPPAPTGLSIPEMFLLVANEGGWDERAEKAKPGHLGGALAGALMLELLVQGRINIQRDRFALAGEPGGDAAAVAVAAKVRRIKERRPDIASLPHMRRLAKWNRELLEPYKDRLAGRGFAEHGHRMHLGLLYRSHVAILDEDAQERLRNKLRRAIAGGGTPEASTILVLGLLDASGLLPTIVPDQALDYNRKRLNGLLSGRDVMGYAVDKQLKGLQEIAVRTILQNVRTMTFG